MRIEECAYDSGLRVKSFGVRVKRVIWHYLRSFEVKGIGVRVYGAECAVLMAWGLGFGGLFFTVLGVRFTILGDSRFVCRDFVFPLGGYKSACFTNQEPVQVPLPCS